MPRFRPSLFALDDRIVPAELVPPFTGTLSETQLVGGLSRPTSMAVAPDGRIFVAEQGGSLRVVKDGDLLAAPFTTVTVDSAGERGLIGVALDPNFTSNGFVYVYYTVPATGTTAAFNRISRFTAAGDVAAPFSERVLMDLDPLGPTNHNGGALQFGPDGKLYVGVGENNIPANAQSLSNRLGKVLRINPDGTIPADNPTAFDGIVGTTAGANRAIWAVGLRNPFTLAFHPTTGRLFVNDVGQGSFEEVDDGRAGANYGWPATEGDFDPARFPALTRPVYAYPHQGTGTDPLAGRSIGGGAFYVTDRPAFPADRFGDYFFVDFIAGRMTALDLGVVPPRAAPFGGGELQGDQPVDVDVGPNGELLYLSYGDGAVFAFRQTGGGPIVAAGVGAGGGPVVGTVDPATGGVVARFLAYEEGFRGGVRVATGDTNGDGVPDLVTGAGPGAGPRVRVFDGATGQIQAGPSRDFFPYEPAFTGGVYVATADFTRDGNADLIVSADVGGGPRVRVIDSATGKTLADFFAFEPAFTGGVRVAAGDVNGDGVPDLIVSAGVGGGPRVAVFDGRDVVAGKANPGRLGGDFFAFEETLRNGAFVTSADVDGDGFDDLIAGAGPGGGPRVTVFSGREYLANRRTIAADFFAGSEADRGGVSVSTVDADRDGVPDIVVGSGAGVASRAAVYRVAGGTATLLREFEPLAAGFTGGVFVG